MKLHRFMRGHAQSHCEEICKLNIKSNSFLFENKNYVIFHEGIRWGITSLGIYFDRSSVNFIWISYWRDSSTALEKWGEWWVSDAVDSPILNYFKNWCLFWIKEENYWINLFSIPLKINPWKGKTEYQYNFPQIPSGLKVADWYKVLLMILNSSQASPGNFISA